MRTEKIQGDGDLDGHEFHGNQWTEGVGSGSASRNGSKKLTEPPIENGKIKLTHYSNKAGLTVLQPYKYGSGIAGQESERKQADPKNWINRTYHGIGVGQPGGYQKESGLGSHKYTTSVGEHDLYDFVGDPDKLYRKAPDWFSNSTSMYEKAIKQHGYKGYWVNHPSLGLTAATFVDLEPEKEEDDMPTRFGSDSFAFDKASLRSYDADGRLHIKLTAISKANVCPYYGREIPDYEELKLDPEKIYQLYRDPKELEKAAPTYNNIQLLSKHIAVSPDDPQKEVIAGATGSDAIFKAPYLMNSLVIWDAADIAGIESGEKKELSCGYRYKADMTPGTANGVKYDGVMRNIVGNHVALVEQGRAGSDVVVGDSRFLSSTNNPELNMAKKVGLSRKAVLAKGALVAHLKPKLASDAKIDLASILTGVTHENWKTKKSLIMEGVAKLTKGKFAKGAAIGDIKLVLDGLDDEPEGGPDDNLGTDEPKELDGTEATANPVVRDGDPDMINQLRALLQGKISDEDMLQVESLCGGSAEPAPSSPDAATKSPDAAEAPDAALPKSPDAGASKTPAADPNAKIANPAGGGGPGAGTPPTDVDGEAALLAKLKSLVDQLSGGAAPAKDSPFPPATPDAPAPAQTQANGAVANATKSSAGKVEPPATSNKEPEMGNEALTKPAMDAAIELAVKKAEMKTIQRMRDIAEAEKIVRPFIGEITMAQDSAEAVYRLALEAHKIDVKDVHPSAFKVMVQMLPKEGEARSTPHLIAQDGAAVESFATRFPDAVRVRNLG